MTIVEALDNRSDQRRDPKGDRASFIAQTFSHALERVGTVGGRIDIFNLVLDADGAYHIYSQLSSYRDPQLLNRSLELFIEAFTPEPEGQTLTNRAIFDGVANRMEDSDEIIRKSHADIRIWRWPTLEDNRR